MKTKEEIKRRLEQELQDFEQIYAEDPSGFLGGVNCGWIDALKWILGVE